MMRFDRFTERAQDAATRAYEILQRYGHNQVDTEHILLALLEQTDGAVPQLMESMQVDNGAAQQRLDDVLRASPKAAIYGGGTGQVFITPRVKRIIDLANEEANRLKDEFISTEHIFLAILSERNTNVARILTDAGVTRERTMEAIKELRGRGWLVRQRGRSAQACAELQLPGGTIAAEAEALLLDVPAEQQLVGVPAELGWFVRAG